MNEWISIGNIIVNKDLLVIAITLLIWASIGMSTMYYRIAPSIKAAGTCKIKSSITSVLKTNYDPKVQRLWFCTQSCSLIDADTKAVIANYNSGSLNCRLLTYCFAHAGKALTEQQIVEHIQPDNPEKFYIRKAVCNLKLDKALRNQLFTFVNSNTIRLNASIERKAGESTV